MATTRRFFLRSVGLTSAGLALLAACGPPAAPAGSPAQNAPAAGAPAPTAQPKPAEAAGTPKRGGMLRVGLIVDVATLDPHLSGSKVDRQVSTTCTTRSWR